MNAAQECGETMQRRTLNETTGTMTYCARAVRRMVGCFASRMGVQDCNAYTANCGDEGKDYVDCTNGALTKCGYRKVDGDSNLCAVPGAIQAYRQTYTKNGIKHGHVQFGCGTLAAPRYCSVYDGLLTTMWPGDRLPSSCWIPTFAPVDLDFYAGTATPRASGRSQVASPSVQELFQSAAGSNLDLVGSQNEEPDVKQAAIEAAMQIAIAKIGAANSKQSPRERGQARVVGVRRLGEANDGAGLSAATLATGNLGTAPIDAPAPAVRKPAAKSKRKTKPKAPPSAKPSATPAVAPAALPKPKE